jgi:YD repeat-containing protein
VDPGSRRCTDAHHIQYQNPQASRAISLCAGSRSRKARYTSRSWVTPVTRRPGTADEATTTYTYDPVWTTEIATITDRLGHTTTIGYDARGNRTTITDALDHTTTFMRV